MAQRYYVELSYVGTPFHGWQIQQNAKSIQQTLNIALSTIIRQNIYCVGCGRTDTGVHAKKFFAHFDAPKKLASTTDVLFRANCLLPKEIALRKIAACSDEFHARFTAIGRTYEYFISTVKNPFSNMRAYEYRESLDLGLMNKACDLLAQHKDFTSFAKLHGDSKTNLCDIHQANWQADEENIVFQISANRFLRNMVRAIVGTMLDVGTAKISLDEFEKIIDLKSRSEAGYSVPAHGLYLVNINYPAEFQIG